MRSKYRFVLGAFAVLLLAATPAMAQQAPQKPAATAKKPAAAKKKIVVKLAVINIEGIRINAKVARDIRSQISKYRKVFRTDIEKEEREIRKANEEMAKQRAILSPDAFIEERKKFELRLIQVQRQVQARKRALDKSQAEAFTKVQEALNEVVIKVAKENNLTLILRSDQVVFWAQALDITEAVLRRLDAKLPSLEVSKPAKKPAKK